jgi:hypothetical protein
MVTRVDAGGVLLASGFSLFDSAVAGFAAVVLAVAVAVEVAACVVA